MSFSIIYPHLANQFSRTLNTDVDISKVTPGMKKRLWWECPKGHAWLSLVANRVKGSGCPYCSGYLVIAGETDLQTIDPIIANQWHPTKNGDKLPSQFTPSSNKKVWWQCFKNHEWEATVNKRTNGRSCPICANKKVLSGTNDLSTTHPDIAAEWHPTKNSPVLPNQIFGGQSRKVWWQCLEGHSYLASPNKRTTSKRGCKFCRGQEKISGLNDLATTHPHIMKQLHTSKNSDIDLSILGYGSNKKVWWQCIQGHEWESSIKSRVQALTDCPDCSMIGTSAVEQKLYQELVKTFPDALSGAKVTNLLMSNQQCFVDIFLIHQGTRIAIEYDGSRWHSFTGQQQTDVRKSIGLLREGIRVIRIRENGISHLPIEDSRYSEVSHQYRDPIDLLARKVIAALKTE